MANVYYKFNSELNFSHVGFDGLHISVGDLKKAILHQKRLGKTADFDLLISNAQTKEEYVEENCLIPKNTSLIVARIPVTNQYKRWEQPQPTHNAIMSDQNVTENVDLSKMNGSEEDKIAAMMVQSTLDYDPSSYQRVRGSNQVGEVPSSYRCHRCHKTGHWIKNCPMNPPIKDHYHKVRPESKKMTGIPRSLRENPPPNKVDPTETQKVVEEKKEPPEDLLCAICKGIFRDAVMIPCCGGSFCDECIRTALLESDDNECPECNEKGTSPGSLIPNRFLRTNVAAFLNESNSNGREKAAESHEEISSRHVEASPQIDDIKEPELNSQKQEVLTPTQIEVESKQEQSHSEDDEDDDDDNITVTVPPASHQCGPVFRDAPGMVRISHRSKEIHERHNTIDESPSSSQGGSDRNERSESSQQKPSQYSDSSYYYNEPYNEQQKSASHPAQNSSYQQEEPESNYMAGPPSGAPQNSLYPPHNMYNQQAPPMRPQFGQFQGQPHQAPFYPQQQNIRPYRYDHHNNFQHPMRHHHHHGPHQQYPMHPGHGNYGMRYQRNDHNLANAVEHNIKQRFGSGVIDDPLEAFNKIMREKEMRKDRRRSPARFNESRSDRARSPVRKYSPDRYKSPQRRRKRTRSFSSNSSRSRSRSRSGDRHHGGERDYRKKHRVTDRNKSSETRSKHNRNKSYDHSPDARKVNQDNSSSASAAHQEIKQTHEEHQNVQQQQQQQQHSQEELISNQPPPPGEEENVEETKVAVESNAEQSRGEDEKSSDEKKAPKDKSVEKSPSSEDNKRSKKVRDKKKHKKSDKKSTKKKKRERKEKRSASRSITEDESILNKNVEATDDEKHSKDLITSPKDDVETSPTTTSAFDKTATSSEHEVDEFKPELSKWEKDESQIERQDDEEIEVKRKPSKESRSDDGKATVTTEILKRAENVLFSKSSTNRLNREKSSSRSKDTSPLPSIIKKVDHDKKIETYHVTVPVESGMRSVEMKSKSSKGEPIRTSIKERLGKKVTERSKSRSRTPERKHHGMNNNKSSQSRQDNRKHLSSTIGTVKTSSKSDMRSREPIRRRSRSHDRRDNRDNKKYQRSKTRSLSRTRDRGNHRTDRHHRSRERERSREPRERSREHREKSREARERSREAPRISKIEPKPQTSRKDQKVKRRSDSPRSDDGNERKKLRSSSAESKKHHKKKKKKEKKAKKKSRDRK